MLPAERAKEEELKSWEENGVFQEIDKREKGRMKVINTRWIMTKMIKDGREKWKARLMARGFEEREIRCRMEAPICSMEGLKLCLRVIKREGWQAHSLDVKTAYLQGKAIDRDIIVRPPLETKTDKL